MAAVSADHDDEIIGVADQPPVAQALLLRLPAALVRVGLPLGGEMLVQRRQGDVGQQRGEYPALRGAGEGVSPGCRCRS